MSRVIRNDHPWTDDEIAYVTARSGGDELVAQNRQQYPPGSDAGDASPDDEDDLKLSQAVYDHVKALTAEEAKAELAALKLDVSGDESDLKVRLAEYLQDQENKKSK